MSQASAERSSSLPYGYYAILAHPDAPRMLLPDLGERSLASVA